MYSTNVTRLDINWNDLFKQYFILSRLLSYLNRNIELKQLLLTNHNFYSAIKIYNLNELLLHNQLNISSIIKQPILKNNQNDIFKQISLKNLQFINKVYYSYFIFPFYFLKFFFVVHFSL